MSTSSSSAAAPAVVGSPSRLISSPINVLALREDARAEFEALLDGLPGGGGVCLVLDPRLIVPLRLVLTEGAKYLREHRVEQTLELSTPALATACETVLYVTRPSLACAALVAAQAKAFDRRGVRKNLHVAFVPRRAFACEQLLRDEGVFSDLQVHEFGLDVFPLDDDVLTMGLDGCFRDCAVGGDPSALFSVTRALLKLQSVYGLVPHDACNRTIFDNARAVRALGALPDGTPLRVVGMQDWVALAREAAAGGARAGRAAAAGDAAR